jgi:hypothetical protein
MSSSNIRPQCGSCISPFHCSYTIRADARLDFRASKCADWNPPAGLWIVHLWLKANASALSKMDQRQYSGTITVIRLPVSQLTDTEAYIQRRPMFELPDSEVKGMLNDTYDVEYIIWMLSQKINPMVE